MSDLDYRKIFCNRLTSLRMEADISAREMSLALGQSASYINKIDNEKTLPSMSAFFDICEYLQVTPVSFFDIETPLPVEINNAIAELNKMDKEQIERLVAVMKDINGSK